jgi:hypothetical protein
LRVGVGGQVDQLLGHRAAGHELAGPVRDVGDLALLPVKELTDEFVELRGPQDASGQRAGQAELLVHPLGDAETGGGLVDADDGCDDDPADSRLLAGLVQVAGRRAEELRRRLLFRGVPRRDVDDDVDPRECLGEAFTGDDVHAGGSGHRNDLVAPFREDVDDVASQPPGRSRHRVLADAHFPCLS